MLLYAATSGVYQHTNVNVVLVKKGVLQYLVSVNIQMLLELNGIRDTCGIRCFNMFATFGPGYAGQCCCIFGAKIFLRFKQICCYISTMHLYNLFDSCWRSNQFIWRFKFEFELITNHIFVQYLCGGNQIQQYLLFFFTKLNHKFKGEMLRIALLFNETQTSLLRCTRFEDT